jgi:hypothetical protein
MLLEIIKTLVEKIKNLPFIKPLFYFSKNHHKQAFPKFGILWFMCTLPVLLSALLSQKSTTDTSPWEGFFNQIFISFSASEQFVYASAFLPPVIYLIYERYQEAEMTGALSDRLRLSFRKVFDGYGVVLIFACLALLTTVITYTGTKTNFANLQQTYLYDLVVSSAHWLYFFSLYCWYLSILDGIQDPSNFLTENKQAENEFSNQFSNRINER